MVAFLADATETYTQKCFLQYINIVAKKESKHFEITQIL